MTQTTSNAESLTAGLDLSAAGSGGASPARSAAAQARRRNLMAAASVVCILAALGIAAYRLLNTGMSPGEKSRTLTVIDSQTGEVIEGFSFDEGTMYPWKNSSTGTLTLYPAERCYWTADGKAKIPPTYVLLNGFADKPGPTLCPDCGREVVPHNPTPPTDLLLQAAQSASGSK